MEIKELLNMTNNKKFKKGNLYLYNPRNHLKRYYTDVPVITLCRNKNYPTWLCLFPNLMAGGVYPDDLTDVTLKKQ